MWKYSETLIRFLIHLILLVSLIYFYINLHKWNENEKGQPEESFTMIALMRLIKLLTIAI